MAPTRLTPPLASVRRSRYPHARRRRRSIDYSGHGSARRDAGSFYINSGCLGPCHAHGRRHRRDRLRRRAASRARDRPPLEFPLHAEIYRVRPDVQAVMHTHPRWSTLLTMVGAPYRPVFPQGALLGDVPVLDSPLSVNTREMGARVAATLGAGPARPAQVPRRRRRRRRTSSSASRSPSTSKRTPTASTWRCRSASPYVFSEAEQEACRARLASPALFQKAWDHYRAKLGH